MKKCLGLYLTLVLLSTATPTPLRSGPRPRFRASPHRQSQRPEAPALVGESITLIPDGQRLILGGEGRKGPVSTAPLQNPATGATITLPQGLLVARAWHTATLLPNGTVLVLGGLGVDGHVVTSEEIFNPSTLRFQSV